MNIGMQEHKVMNDKLIFVKRNQFHGWEIETQRLFELAFDTMLRLFKTLFRSPLVIQW